MADDEKVDGGECSEDELEAMFAAEVASEKAQQVDAEPTEEELEAMFAEAVSAEAPAAVAPVSAPPVAAPSPAPVRAPVVVQPVMVPSFDNLPGQSSAEPPKDINLDMILDIPVNVHVEVGHTRVKVQEILRLDVGSVVELNRVAGHPADIIVNGKLIGQGDVVVVNENFGIRVTKLVGLEERMRSV